MNKKATKIGVTQNELRRGTQIAYIQGDEFNWDAEFGFVTSVHVNGENAFCRYWRKDLKGLRTKACSENTPLSRLVLHKSVPDEQVKDALEQWCY